MSSTGKRASRILWLVQKEAARKDNDRAKQRADTNKVLSFDIQLESNFRNLEVLPVKNF